MAIPIAQLDSITQKYFVPKLYDNIFKSNVLLNRAKTKKWYKKLDGGTKITVPVAYAPVAAANAGWYTGAGTLGIADTLQLTAAEFDWKQAYANITISRADELKNNGKAQVINLIKTKMSLAEKTLADNLGTGLFNDGTVTNGLIGLRLAVNETTTGTAQVYGGIDRDGNSWWNAQTTTSVGALTLAKMNTAFGDAIVGNDKPTVCVTTQTIFDAYMGLLQANQRFTDSKTADAGFQNVLFQGIPVVVDSHVPTGYMYMLNENYLDLFVHSKEDMRFSGFVKPKDQNVTIGQIFWMGALTCSNPRMQVSMAGVTA